MWPCIRLDSEDAYLQSQLVGDRSYEVSAPLPVERVHLEIHGAPDGAERLEQGSELPRLPVDDDVDVGLSRHPAVLKQIN